MKQQKLGVIVARLQVPELHEGHRYLIDCVLEQVDHVLLVLGTSSLDGKVHVKPLPFESRKLMVEEIYSTQVVTVVPLGDIPSNDEAWSQQLDALINQYADSYQEVRLYGSRDSFIKYYVGGFECVEVDQLEGFSGTDMRQAISKQIPVNYDQRIGAIWATQQPYPTAYTTVDIAIFNEDFSQIRLARKPFETKYRFVGGFVDPSDISYAHAAYRELQEETGIAVDGVSAMKYIGDFPINDGRYAGTGHSIKTNFFYVQQQWGGRPMDDIEELRWFDYQTLTKEDLMPVHYDLLDHLIEAIPQDKLIKQNK